MDGPTGYVEIPGYREALRREAEVRRAAWSKTHDEIAGVRVRVLTWRDVEKLADMRNGFFCPWKFETEDELVGHCAQLVWWLSDCAKPNPGAGFISRAIVQAQAERLVRHLAKDKAALIGGVTRFLQDSFMDAPTGNSQDASAPAAASFSYIADALAFGGHHMTADEALDMPVARLWQLLKLIRIRLCGEKPTSPSDKIAVDYLAKMNKEGTPNV